LDSMYFEMNLFRKGCRTEEREEIEGEGLYA
jgi:hypothetical protein